MAKVTNNTRSTLNFKVDVKDGAVVMGSVRAGETADLDIDENDPQVKGHLHAGAITIGAKAAKAARPADKPGDIT